MRFVVIALIAPIAASFGIAPATADGLTLAAPGGPNTQGQCYASGSSGPRVPCVLQGQTWVRVLRPGDPADGLTVLSRGSSNARALADRALDNGYSVLDYGPNVGAGGDDSAAINATLRAACDYSQAGPATKTCKVIFPEPPSGAYNVCASSITLPGYAATVALEGRGAAPKIRIKPDCATPPDQVIYQPVTTGDTSGARVYIDNLTFDGYCKSRYNLYSGYAVGMTITRSVFRNVKAGANNANIWLNGGYELSIDRTNRAENVNEQNHVCYSSADDLPDYNFVTYTSDSWFGLSAVDAKIANYWNANSGANHYADAHGWGFTGVWPIQSAGNLSPQYNFLIDGAADLTNVVADTYRTAAIYLRSAKDGNGVPNNLSGTIINASAVIGGSGPSVLLDPGLTGVTVTSTYLVGTGIQSVSGALSTSNIFRDNPGPATSKPQSDALVSPVIGGDTAQLTAYGPGGGVALNAQSPTDGSNLYLRAKGAAAVQLGSNGTTAFSAYANPGAVNYLGVTANTTGYGPNLAAVGSDANIALAVSGKGTLGVETSMYSLARDPNGGDLPVGYCADWYNTSVNTFKRWCNFNGTLKSIAYQ